MAAYTDPTYEESRVKHVRVSAYCKSHNKTLGWDGQSIYTYPPRFKHLCPDGCEYLLLKVYPTIEVRDEI